MSLAPLFNEINIFGIKIRKELDSAKKELEYKIQNIQNTLLAVNQNQTINFPSPSPDPILTEILNRLPEATTTTTTTTTPAPTVYAPEINTRYFTYRFAIEQELRRIAKNRLQMDLERRVTLVRLIDELKRFEILEGDIFVGIREIISICNNAIHGEEIKETQIRFVDSMAQGIIDKLKTI